MWCVFMCMCNVNHANLHNASNIVICVAFREFTEVSYLDMICNVRYDTSDIA